MGIILPLILGSGFIIEENGIVITNNHVVANAEDILVRVGDKEYDAKTFALYCVKGIKADKKRIKHLLNNSLMLVTALAPKIGYDKAASVAKAAHKNGTTLKQEVIKSGLIKEKDYDKIMDPIKMTKPK